MTPNEPAGGSTTAWQEWSNNCHNHRERVSISESSLLRNLTRAVSRLEQLASRLNTAAERIYVEKMKTLQTPSAYQSLLWVLSRVITSNGWAEMSEQIVQARGKWKHSSQTSKNCAMILWRMSGIHLTQCLLFVLSLLPILQRDIEHHQSE